MQMTDDEREKKAIMQANEKQLIILQSISKAPILIKGLKDESMEVGASASRLFCPFMSKYYSDIGSSKYKHDDPKALMCLEEFVGFKISL